MSEGAENNQIKPKKIEGAGTLPGSIPAEITAQGDTTLTPQQSPTEDAGFDFDKAIAEAEANLKDLPIGSDSEMAAAKASADDYMGIRTEVVEEDGAVYRNTKIMNRDVKYKMEGDKIVAAYYLIRETTSKKDAAARTSSVREVPLFHGREIYNNPEYVKRNPEWAGWWWWNTSGDTPRFVKGRGPLAVAAGASEAASDAEIPDEKDLAEEGDSGKKTGDAGTSQTDTETRWKAAHDDVQRKLAQALTDLEAAKKTPGTADDEAAQKRIDKLTKELRELTAELETVKKSKVREVPKEVIKTVQKEWSGNTLDEWQHGPEIGARLARIRAANRVRSESHSTEATKLNRAKALLALDAAEKNKPFWMRMVVGTLAGLTLSAAASPIAGLVGLTWLTPLLWRGGTSAIAGAAIGGMVTKRLKNRNFKHAGIWGLAAGIVAGLGSFIGGQMLSDWLSGAKNGTLSTGGGTFSDTPLTQNGTPEPYGPPEQPPSNPEKQGYTPPSNINPTNPRGIYNI